MIVVTVSDVEDLNSKLGSDRAKVREEGLKALQSYLNSTSEVSFWTILDQETEADQSRIRSSSWPGVLHALCVCIDNEVAASKKKGPKLLLAKILRNFVSKAEDSSRAGPNLRLLRKIKRLFQHVVEVLEKVPTFVSDYNNVLCQLLPVSEYRIRMGKKTYADLLHLYADKAKGISRFAAAESSMTREEDFRNISTLLSLLQYPPGDLPEVLLQDMTEDFIEIFSNLRDEGRIAKKILAALNSFIIGNGLNIGSAVARVHASVRPFLVRAWVTTRDRDVKDGLVLYARAQLSLRYILSSDLDEVSQLMELVEKDLDQGGPVTSGSSRLDAGRVEKLGFVTKSMRSLLELAAALLFENILLQGANGTEKITSKISKRRRKAAISVLLKDRLMEGKFMWGGAFCLLIRRFGSRLSFEMILDWLEGLASSLDRLLLGAVNSRNFEGPFWIMRCIQELASLWERQSQQISHLILQAESAWLSVWSATLHWLPLLSNVQGMVEESFRLLGTLAVQSALPACNVPHEFWDAHFFTEPPSANMLYFIISLHVKPSTQMIHNDLVMRKRLLDWCLMPSDTQDISKIHVLFEEHLSPRLLSTALLALTFGVIPGTSNIYGSCTSLRTELSWPTCECEPYLEPDEFELAQEVDLSALNRAEYYLIPTDKQSQQDSTPSTSTNQLPRPSIEELLQRMTVGLLRGMSVASDDSQCFTILQLLHLSTVVSGCIYGVTVMTERWGQIPDNWSYEGAIREAFSTIFLKSTTVLCNVLALLNGDQLSTSQSPDLAPIIGHKSPVQLLTSLSTVKTVKALASSVQGCAFLTSGGIRKDLTVCDPLLKDFVQLAGKTFLYVSGFERSQPTGGGFISGSHSGISQDSRGCARLIDSDLDLDMEPVTGAMITGDSGNLVNTRKNLTSPINSREIVAELRDNLLQMIVAIGNLIPDEACAIFSNMLVEAKNPKVRGDILSSFCEASCVKDPEHLSLAVSTMESALAECEQSESMRYLLLTALDKLSSSLSNSDKYPHKAAAYDTLQEEETGVLPQVIFSRVAELICKVADMGLVLWPTRLKLVEAMSQYILLNPSAAQVLADRFLVLLHDPEYRVRLWVSRKVTVLFEIWDGHDELLQDVCCNFGVKIVTISKERRIYAGDALKTSQEAVLAETALLSLGEIAVASAKVERDAVFIVCLHAALNPSARHLSSVILNKVAKRLNYQNRWKYMAQLLPQVLTSWAISNINVSRLTEVRELFLETSAEDFLQQCCPWVLPWLIHFRRTDEIQWLATVLSSSTPDLVKQYFESVIARILPLYHDPNAKNQREAAKTLQVSMLELADLSEDERDVLIQKKMVRIVSSLFGLCTSRESPQLPQFSKERIIATIKTVVDGFLDSDQGSQDENIIDKMQIFRPDRVFKFILQFHFELFAASHPRHREQWLSSVGALIHVLGIRASVPGTFRYLIHVILESLESDELQDDSCILMTDLLDQVDKFDADVSSEIVGEQLQSIVTKLVSCCRKSLDRSHTFKGPPKMLLTKTLDNDKPPSALSLLHRLIVESRSSLHEYIKDLNPFPSFPYFETIRNFMESVCTKRTLVEDFVQFVKEIPFVPSEVRFSSVKKLQNQLHKQREDLFAPPRDMDKHGGKWRRGALFVDSVWKLVRLCDKHDDPTLNDLAGEFLAVVGVGDPHAVVFHLPDTDDLEELTWFKSNFSGRSADRRLRDCSNAFLLGISDSLLREIIMQLRGFLIDPDVNVIDIASTALKGILSTERGQSIFVSMTKEEKTYLEGVNLNIVEGMVTSMKQKSLESAVSLNDADIWKTSGKSYDLWICTLTLSLIGYTEDTILRLCQDILALKAPLAELVFPHVLGALARDHSADSDLCIDISRQVEEHVFNDVNQSTRSVSLFLTALNSLRQHYIHLGMTKSSASKRKEAVKLAVSGGSGGGRAKHRQSTSGAEYLSRVDFKDGSSASWNKVYWLQIDYLSTAKAAQRCAAYFTSVLYVEYWCDETFGSVTLGPPDFSSDDEPPLHLELLVKVYTRINEPDGVYGVVRSHKVKSQLSRYEHEGNWSKALENYDLLLRIENSMQSSLSTQALKHQPQLKKTEQPVSLRRESLPNWQLQKGLMKSLQHNGLSHILQVYQCGVSQQETGLLLDADFIEMQFEAAWRNGNWENVKCASSSTPNVLCGAASGTMELCFHSRLHSCLRSLVDGDLESFMCSMGTATRGIVSHIAQTSLESTQNVNPLIVKLQMLACVSLAWEMRWIVQKPLQNNNDNLDSEPTGSVLSGPLVPSREQIAAFEMVWHKNLEDMKGHYELAEPYIALHKVLLNLLNLNDHIPAHLLRFGSFSRKARMLNHSEAAIHELKCICARKSSKQIISEAVASRYGVAGRVEEAKILWAEGYHEMAVNLAKYVLQADGEGTDVALLLCMTGKWLAETRSSSSRVILDSYLKRAVEKSASTSGDETKERTTIRICRTHFRLAHYADALFRNHQERLMSSEWQSALRLRQHKGREFEALRERLLILKSDPTEDPIKIREYSMKVIEMQKQLSIDAEEARHLQDDKDQFLRVALENYRSCLCISGKYDLRVVFRMMALWFGLSTNEHVMKAMIETVQKVQSYKFLPLMYQIASRLGGSKESIKDLAALQAFQKTLSSLLKKMAIEHPYHSLYQLFALANGDRVKERQRGKNVFVVDMDKKRAAEELLSGLSSHHGDLQSQVKRMIEMYIRLAEMETNPKDANRKLPIPRDIRSVRELEKVPIVTAHIPIDHSCQYDQQNFAYFKGFAEGIKVMNGINAPKYIECLGSDGRKYRQLAKSGNDDLRQDAAVLGYAFRQDFYCLDPLLLPFSGRGTQISLVMEQLFDLVNNLLQDHPDTRKRNLGIRTYKVVPFTPSAGVLEWVDGTIPVGEYLLGSDRLSGAHGRYGGDDWTFVMCREHMCTGKDKRQAFDTVLKNFRPVMHNFFLENFAQAENWFEKRLAYTRSVATSSMVGYIVGLGDRHSMNVLLDQASAEVVHIDLGVAFEQGLMLKTPERIPFRLTRDVVDGMGVTGVEGTFRRCCEATLSVLRTNKEALLTIVEVFIYDPLYNWALSPLKALQRQQELEDLDDDSTDTENFIDVEGNKDAARALFRVKQKLDGYEEGEMRSLEGQVQQLIQDAQDPERLCQLFPGWGAWV